MKLKVLTLALGLGALSFTACNNKPGKDVALNNEIDSVSYCLGATFGTNVMNGGIEDINMDAFMAALQSAFDKDSLSIQPMEANRIIGAYVQKMRAAKAEQNKAEGAKFLEANKSKDGVITTESGLQYRIIREGDGAKPVATDKVKVHYKGTLIDGTEFDSSLKAGKPVEFPANRVIKGWTEALQLMPVGSKWELFIPYNLAYGARGTRGIAPFSTLIFEVELLDIVKDSKK
ncbi:MAG: FKBP-type peptidyl-prolyl cis-trans isomerase [Marinifilaceae bacterium]